MTYHGKLALVLGLGESGLAMALWLARSGARVRVADTREAPQRLPALLAAHPDAEFVGGEFDAGLLGGVDALDHSRAAMYDHIQHLMRTARDVLTTAGPDMEDVIVPQDNGRLLGAATRDRKSVV